MATAVHFSVQACLQARLHKLLKVINNLVLEVTSGSFLSQVLFLVKTDPSHKMKEATKKEFVKRVSGLSAMSLLVRELPLVSSRLF